MRAARVDGNQKSIVDRLRSCAGVSVQSLAKVGEGCPDLLVGVTFGTMTSNFIFELKDPKSAHSRVNPKGKSKAAQSRARQLAWIENWAGPCFTAETLEQIVDEIEMWTGIRIKEGTAPKKGVKP